MTGDRPVVPAWPRRPAVDSRELLLWGLLSLLLHAAIVVLFVEAAGDGAARGGRTDREALTVRLRLPWQVRSADQAADVSPPPAQMQARRAPPGSASAPAPDTAPTVTSGAQVLAREPLPPIEMPAMRPLDENVVRLAEPPPPPRVVAEPLARIAPLPTVAVPEVPKLAEPPPRPRIAAQPLPPIAPLPAPATVPETPRLSEPPPRPRITAEALPKAAVLPTLSIPDAPLLAEPAPFPRIDAQPLPRIESSPPMMKSVDVVPLAEPEIVGAPARQEPAPAVPAAASGGVTGGVAPTAPPPQRFDFGPRRVVDPDLAALVGEAPSAAAPPGRVDATAIRDVARELNRTEGGARGRRGTEPGGPAEPESTLGRAIARAAQPDCRLAYSGLGLLGLPFLLFDTMTDTGCRW